MRAKLTESGSHRKRGRFLGFIAEAQLVDGLYTEDIRLTGGQSMHNKPVRTQEWGSERGSFYSVIYPLQGITSSKETCQQHEILIQAFWHFRCFYVVMCGHNLIWFKLPYTLSCTLGHFPWIGFTLVSHDLFKSIRGTNVKLS